MGKGKIIKLSCVLLGIVLIVLFCICLRLNVFVNLDDVNNEVKVENKEGNKEENVVNDLPEIEIVGEVEQGISNLDEEISQYGKTPISINESVENIGDFSEIVKSEWEEKDNEITRVIYEDLPLLDTLYNELSVLLSISDSKEFLKNSESLILKLEENGIDFKDNQLGYTDIDTWVNEEKPILMKTKYFTEDGKLYLEMLKLGEDIAEMRFSIPMNSCVSKKDIFDVLTLFDKYFNTDLSSNPKSIENLNNIASENIKESNSIQYEIVSKHSKNTALFCIEARLDESNNVFYDLFMMIE